MYALQNTCLANASLNGVCSPAGGRSGMLLSQQTGRSRGLQNTAALSVATLKVHCLMLLLQPALALSEAARC
jgi:hypothetical protein